MEPAGVRPRRQDESMDASELQNHCSLRLPPRFFATQRAAVEAAGYDAGEGFIKLPYDRELPIELPKALMKATGRGICSDRRRLG